MQNYLILDACTGEPRIDRNWNLKIFLFNPINELVTINRFLIFLNVFFSCYLDFVAGYVNNINYVYDAVLMNNSL